MEVCNALLHFGCWIATERHEAPPSADRPPHPALALLRRYAAIVKLSSAHRHEMVGPARLADEAAFLPAALCLQESPLHPAHLYLLSPVQCAGSQSRCRGLNIGPSSFL